MAIENVELVHECCPQHLRIETPTIIHENKTKIKKEKTSRKAVNLG